MSGFTKKGKNQDPTQCPNGIDTTTFFSPLIPDEIRKIVPLFHSTPLEILKIYIGAVVSYLLSHSIISNLSEEIYAVKSPANTLTPDQINAIITALYFILKISMRNKVKLSVIAADLAKMNIPAPLIEEIALQVKNNRLSFESLAIANRVQFHKLEKVRWRIDVVISSGSLSRVMRPNILMQMIMKDGTIVPFEITYEQFCQLRYSVAKVLYDMQTLERHPIIRIVNEFRRREEEDYNN